MMSTIRRIHCILKLRDHRTLLSVIVREVVQATQHFLKSKLEKVKIFNPKKVLFFQEAELPSSKTKTLFIFQEIELSTFKIKNLLRKYFLYFLKKSFFIFRETELSYFFRDWFFLYFGKWKFLALKIEYSKKEFPRSALKKLNLLFDQKGSPHIS